MSAQQSIWSRFWPEPLTAEKVKEDPKGERGAIMVMGVFLACSMIAAMWYMMGIGDAILWRDRQQEAADSIAFTSAAVHARGMNFIAMINIIMLLIVAVFLIACILRSVLDLILYVTGDCTKPYCWPVWSLQYTEGHGAISALGQITGFFAGSNNVPRYGDAKCGGDAPGHDVIAFLSAVTENIIDNSAGRDLAIACASCPFWTCPVCFIPKCIASHPMHDISCEVGPIYNKVEKFIAWWEETIMKIVLPKLHSVEVATSVLTPWVAAGVSVWAGYQYKDGPSQEPATKIGHKGIAISPSMFRKMKKPEKVKILDPSLEWIPCANQQGCGNGCGPTLCNDGKLSRSGGRKSGTSGTTAECCTPGTSGCTLSGTCSSHGGVAADQSKMYIETTVGTGDYRIGLPVQGQNMNELCEKSFSFIGDGISGMMNNFKSGLSHGGNAQSDGSTKGRGGGSNSGGGTNYSTGGLISSLFNAAGGWFKKAYCTWDPTFSAAHSSTGDYKDVFPGEDGSWQNSCKTQVCAGQKCPLDANDFWAINDTDKCPFENEIGHKIPLLFDGDHGAGNGPMRVVDYAPNGEDYNQVYSLVLNDNYNPFTAEYGTGNTQTAWSKIRLGAGVKGWNKDASTDDTTGMGLAGNGPVFYLAEAEFYHDCEGNWNDTECNGNDHAMYRLNWRTRLRRLRRPIYIQDLTGKIPGGVTKVANFASKYAFEINLLSVNYAGVDLSTVLNAFDIITALGTSDPNGLMPPYYH